jgi:hypothetical protein
MAKETGLGWTTCSVDDNNTAATPALRAIINDVTSLDFSTPRGVQDTTGIDKSAMERLLLLADCSITLNGVFNDAATTGSHTVLSTITNSAVARSVTLTVSGQTLNDSNTSGGVEILFTDYTVTRSASGELTFSASGDLADGAVPTWTS